MQRKTYEENGNKLNFRINIPAPTCAESLGENLNFNINDYDGVYILFKVLVDFIENYSLGDVFLIVPLVDLIIDQYG